MGEKYTASSFLKVEMQERSVLTDQVTTMDRDRFEIFKSTQQEQLLSRFVLLAALRKPEVAKIPHGAGRTEARRGCRGLAASGSCRSAFRERRNIMEVSITRPDAHEATVLVNAVVDSYLTDVVEAERDQKQQRLNKLETACAAKELANPQHAARTEEPGDSSTELRRIPRRLPRSKSCCSTTTPSTIRSWRRRNLKSRSWRANWWRRQALLKNVDAGEVPAEEVDMLLNTDPVARELAMQLAMKKQEQMINDNAVSPGSKNHYAERYSRDLKSSKTSTTRKSTR